MAVAKMFYFEGNLKFVEETLRVVLIPVDYNIEQLSLCLGFCIARRFLPTSLDKQKAI